MFYLLNAFSPSMLYRKMGYASFTKLTQEEAKRVYMAAKEKNEKIVNAIGHESTAKIASIILGDNITVNRTAVMLLNGDYGLIFVLSFRPEEGKVYDFAELRKLLNEHKMEIYAFSVGYE